MCGIAGFQNFGKELKFDKKKKIKVITDVIDHRGPDSFGFWNCDEDNIYLGHRRLSILDLSSRGDQPMFSNSKRYVIIFNGEIYNYRKLKNYLEKKFNVIFNNNTDTQVILELISIYGFEKSLDYLEGMFSLAVWDRKTKTLFLARDRFGEKPLFYYLNNEIIIFSSELKSIKKFFSFKKLSVNKKAAEFYSLLGYIPAPLTIFNNVFKVLPSEFLKVNNGKVTKKKYFNYAKNFCSYEHFNNDENTFEIKKLLEKSVNKMMIADVEVGCFLSGGIDSSLIASLMQKNSMKKIKTYTVGFNEKQYDESEFAKKISNHIGTDHKEIIISVDDMMDNIEKISDQFDEPFSDSSCLPTELISRFASKDVKVVLSGDGGDEMFLGYNRYLFAKKMREFQSKTPKKFRSLLQSSLNFFPTNLLDFFSQPFQKYFGIQAFSHKIMKLSNILEFESNSDFYKKLNSIDNYQLNKNKDNRFQLFDNYNHLSLIDSVQFNDIDFYLSNDILTKVDRTSMKNSLEVRSPFLDHILTNKVFSISSSKKIMNNQLKFFLKDILKDYVPSELFLRPKMGFAIPIDKWLRKNRMVDLCNDIFFNVNWETLGYKGTRIIGIWEDYKKYKNCPPNTIWTYLIAGLWIQNN